MEVGGQADMVNGPTSMARRQLLRFLHFLRAPFSFSKDRPQQRRAQPSQDPRNEFSRAQPRPRRHPRLQRLLSEFSTARRRLRRAADSLLWRLEWRLAQLKLRLKARYQQVLKSLRLAPQPFWRSPSFLRLLDKLNSVPPLCRLFLLLLAAAVINGSRRLIHRLTGLLSQVRAIPGRINPVRAIPGRGRQPRQPTGQNKPTLRPAGLKQHED